MADIRTIKTNIEAVRDSSDSSMKIKGYALQFNEASQPIPFIEYIKPNALDNVDLSDVMLLYGHEYNSILAKTTAGTLSLTVDETGLAFTATLPDTTLGHDTYNNIIAGNLSGMSFGFTIADDDWLMNESGDTVHIINSIESISEISVTPIPAYSETSVEVTRSLEKFKKRGEEMNEELLEQFKTIAAQMSATVEQQTRSNEPVDPDPEPIKPEQPAIKDEPKPVEPAKSDPEQPIKSAEPVASTQTRSIEKGDAKMPKIISETKKDAHIRALENYLVKNERDASATGSFSTADGSMIIPTEILDIYKQPKDTAQLASYVTKMVVSTPSGTLPILAKATAQMTTAQEDADNPLIEKPTLKEVAYKVQTYRGQLPITWEMTKDYPGIVSLLSEYLQDIISQTEQHKIGKVLQKATAVTATSTDDLKTAFNIGLTPYTDKLFVVTESMYNVLDQLKDGNGRYLLQDSITSASGKSLFGASVVIVADDVLGAEGDTKMFVGSVKSFVLEVLKENVAVEWVRNESFTMNLASAYRADYIVADDLAGKFITFTPKSTPAPAK